MDPNRAGNFQSPFGFFNRPKTTSKRRTMAPPPFNLVSSGQDAPEPPVSPPPSNQLPLPSLPFSQRKDSLSTGLEFLGQMDLSTLRNIVELPQQAAPESDPLHFDL